jgi:hypothetical protein
VGFLDVFTGVAFGTDAFGSAGFSALGARTFLAGAAATGLVAAGAFFFAGVAVADGFVLLAGVAATAFLAAGFLAGAALVTGAVVFLLDVAMIFPFKIGKAYDSFVTSLLNILL